MVKFNFIPFDIAKKCGDGHSEDLCNLSFGDWLVEEGHRCESVE